MSENLKFFVIVTGKEFGPSTIDCLESIRTQSYREFECYIVDDRSKEKAEKVIPNLYEKDPRFHLLRNERRSGHLVGLREAIQRFANDDDVVVEVDADDKLAHTAVLARVAKEYERGALLTYGSFTTKKGVISHPRPYPSAVVRQNAFRDYYWFASHLKTYKVSLFKRIKKEDFKVDGKDIKVACDRAIMLPMLEMVGERAHFIPDILYIYSGDGRVRSKKELETVEKIHKKPKYDLAFPSHSKAKKPLSVLISVPCLPFGDITGGLADWLVRTLAGGWPGLNLKYDRVEDKWPAVRNKQLQQFLDFSDSDFLLLIDSDIVPHPHVLKMVEHNVDFCSAVCFSFQFEEPFAVMMTKDPKGRDGYIQDVPLGTPGLYERDATGLACTVISRKLATEFRGTFRDRFDNEGKLHRDADFDFCERIKAAGYKVYVDTRFVCGHKKPLDLKKIQDLLVRNASRVPS